MDKMPVKFLPQNKHLLVSSFKEVKEEQSGISLPDDYKKAENPYQIAQLLDTPDESPLLQHRGSYVLVPTNMIEKISVHGLNVEMVPEHAVCAIIRAEEMIKNDQ